MPVVFLASAAAPDTIGIVDAIDVVMSPTTCSLGNTLAKPVRVSITDVSLGLGSPSKSANFVPYVDIDVAGGPPASCEIALTPIRIGSKGNPKVFAAPSIAYRPVKPTCRGKSLTADIMLSPVDFSGGGGGGLDA